MSCKLQKRVHVKYMHEHVYKNVNGEQPAKDVRITFSVNSCDRLAYPIDPLKYCNSLSQY